MTAANTQRFTWEQPEQPKPQPVAAAPERFTFEEPQTAQPPAASRFTFEEPAPAPSAGAVTQRVLQRPDMKAMDPAMRQVAVDQAVKMATGVDPIQAQAQGVQQVEAQTAGALQTGIRATGKQMGSLGAGAVGLVDPARGAGMQEALDFTYPTDHERPAAMVGQGVGSAITFAPALAGGPAALLTLGGATAAAGGSARADIYNRRQQGQDISGRMEALNVTANAGAELLTELAGLRILKGIGAQAAKSLAPQLSQAIASGNAGLVARQVMQTMGGAVAGASAAGATEEAITQVAQNLIDKYTIDGERGVFDGVKGSMVAGAVGGGLLAGPAVLAGRRGQEIAEPQQQIGEKVVEQALDDDDQAAAPPQPPVNTQAVEQEALARVQAEQSRLQREQAIGGIVNPDPAQSAIARRQYQEGVEAFPGMNAGDLLAGVRGRATIAAQSPGRMAQTGNPLESQAPPTDPGAGVAPPASLPPPQPLARQAVGTGPVRQGEQSLTSEWAPPSPDSITLAQPSPPPAPSATGAVRAREAVLPTPSMTGSERGGEGVVQGEIVEPDEDLNLKPAYEMSPEEVDDRIEHERTFETRLLDRLFGKDGAKEYNRLQRAANSTYRTHDETSAASAKLEAMEERLTERQRDELFGVNQPQRPGLEDLRAIRESLSGVDFDSEEAMGRSLRWAITDVGSKEDPAEMTPKEQRAYATLRYASEKMRELGLDEAKVMEAAVKASASRFSDPADAEYMLRRFIKPKQDRPAPANPIATLSDSPRSMGVDEYVSTNPDTQPGKELAGAVAHSMRQAWAKDVYEGLKAGEAIAPEILQKAQEYVPLPKGLRGKVDPSSPIQPNPEREDQTPSPSTAAESPTNPDRGVRASDDSTGWREFRTDNGPEKLMPGTRVRVAEPLPGFRNSPILEGQAAPGTEFAIDRSNGFLLTGGGHAVDARNMRVEVLDAGNEPRKGATESPDRKSQNTGENTPKREPTAQESPDSAIDSSIPTPKATEGEGKRITPANLTGHLEKYQSALRKQTGQRDVKIGYHRELKHYVELPDSVTPPEGWTRVQTTRRSVRYHTPELDGIQQALEASPEYKRLELQDLTRPQLLGKMKKAGLKPSAKTTKEQAVEALVGLERDTTTGDDRVGGPAAPEGKQSYTTIPADWKGKTLANYSGGSERLEGKGAKATGDKGRKTATLPLAFRNQLDKIPNSAKRLLAHVKGQTDEVWKVVGKAGGYHLAPRGVVAEAKQSIPDWQQDVEAGKVRKAERKAADAQKMAEGKIVWGRMSPFDRQRLIAEAKQERVPLKEYLARLNSGYYTPEAMDKRKALSLTSEEWAALPEEEGERLAMLVGDEGLESNELDPLTDDWFEVKAQEIAAEERNTDEQQQTDERPEARDHQAAGPADRAGGEARPGDEARGAGVQGSRGEEAGAGGRQLGLLGERFDGGSTGSQKSMFNTAPEKGESEADRLDKQFRASQTPKDKETGEMFPSHPPKDSETGEVFSTQRAKDVTESKAFRDWFGGSKVVDDGGEPMVVYHGTASDFTEFKAGGSFKHGHGKMMPGIYLTPLPNTASAYARTAANAADRSTEFDRANVMPVYAAIQNPAEFTDSEKFAKASRAKLEAAGHDGAVRRNQFGEVVEIVAFHPEQIKSATGNIGTFDPTNKDIRYATERQGQADREADRAPSQARREADARPGGEGAAGEARQAARDAEAQRLATPITTASLKARLPFARILSLPGVTDVVELPNGERFKVTKTTQASIYAKTLKNEKRFTESILRDAGKPVEMIDGSTVRIPKNARGLQMHPQRDLIYKSYVATGAWNSETKTVVYAQEHAHMEVIEEELFHAAMSLAATGAQRRHIDGKYGDEEQAYQAYLEGESDPVLDAFRDDSIWTGKAGEGSKGRGSRFSTQQATKDPTQTAAFKKWFGDSAVVDADGKPLRVFHGTGAADPFNAFKRRRNDIGIHFGTSGQANDRVAYKSRGSVESTFERLYPVYLRIENPLRLPDLGAWDADNVGWKLADLGIIPKDTRWGGMTLTQLRDAITSRGYDGIVYANTGETQGADSLREAAETARELLIQAQKRRGRPTNGLDQQDQQTPEYKAMIAAEDAYQKFREENAEDSYIVFDPRQIKSATANVGTFSSKNPDIRFAVQRVNRGNQSKPDLHRDLAIIAAARATPDLKGKELLAHVKSVMADLDANDADALKVFAQARKILQTGELHQLAKTQNPGQFTVGNPKLANPAETPEARRVIDALDQQRKDNGEPEVRKDAEVWKEAKAKLDADYAGEKKRILSLIDAGEVLNDTDTLVAKTLTADAALKGIRDGDVKAWGEAVLMGDAWRESGTQQARALRQRFDPKMGPADRLKMYVAETLTQPSPKAKRELDKLRKAARNATDKAKKIYKARMKAIFDTEAKKAARVQKRLRDMGINPHEITDERLSDRRFAGRVARAISTARASTGDKLREYWINAILSAPTTQGANIIGNSFYGTWETTAQRMVEALVNTVVRDKDSATFGEVEAMVKGFMPAMARAGRNFILAYSTELPVLADDIKRAGGEVTGGNSMKLELSESRASIPGKRGVFVRSGFTGLGGTKMLLAMDELFKGLYGTLNAYAYAYRRARNGDLPPDLMPKDGSTPKLTHKQAVKVAESMVADMSHPLWTDALAESERLSFQNEPGMGGPTDALLRIRRNHPMLTFVLPFVVTPVNIFKAGLNKTPLQTLVVLSRAAKHGMVKLNLSDSGYVYEKQQVVRDVANSVVGWSLAMAMMAMVDDDEGEPRITGSAARDPGERNLQYATAPPMSIRIGDKWYSYRRIEPMAVSLATVVDAIRAMQRAETDSDFATAADSVIKSVLDQTRDKTFLRGIGDLIEMFEGPESFGSKSADFISNFAASWVPNVIRSAGRATDDSLRDNRIRKDGDGSLFWNAVERTKQRALPGIVEAPPPKVDIWGQPISAKQYPSPASDFLYRLTVPVVQKDAGDTLPLNRLLVNWNAIADADPTGEKQPYYPRTPLPIMQRQGKTLRLTDREYERLLREGGENAAKRLRGLHAHADNPRQPHIDLIEKARRDAYSDVRDRIWRDRRRAMAENN